MLLLPLIEPYRSLSIIGMCKNAGKTTVLNRILSEMQETGKTLGLTSIGRDGESVDVVTQTHKPGIYVREGTLIATAVEMLKYCDISRELSKLRVSRHRLARWCLCAPAATEMCSLQGRPSRHSLQSLQGLFFARGRCCHLWTARLAARRSAPRR